MRAGSSPQELLGTQQFLSLTSGVVSASCGGLGGGPALLEGRLGGRLGGMLGVNISDSV